MSGFLFVSFAFWGFMTWAAADELRTSTDPLDKAFGVFSLVMMAWSFVLLLGRGGG